MDIVSMLGIFISIGLAVLIGIGIENYFLRRRHHQKHAH